METLKAPPVIDLRAIFQNTALILSIIGMFLNALLLWLIFCKTSKIFAHYKIILIQNCLVDVFFNFITVKASVFISLIILPQETNGLLAFSKAIR